MAKVLASSITDCELTSLAVYKKPIFLTSGVSSLQSSKVWSTGIASDVPVTLADGLLKSSTSLAPIGSVTAENTTGISLVAAAIAWAAGVAMAIIKSAFSPTNLLAIVFKFDWSAWAFW